MTGGTILYETTGDGAGKPRASTASARPSSSRHSLRTQLLVVATPESDPFPFP
ncbi:MAG: hypothetical protein WKF40_04865 [Thermoleophilaceae bacterium]